MVVIDTSVIIDHLRQSPGKLTYFAELVKKYPTDKLAISMITVQELYEGKSTKNEKHLSMLLVTISRLRILSYTYEVAKRAGEVARDSDRRIELPDAAIAATAILNKAFLATLNKKDFQGIKDLEFV